MFSGAVQIGFCNCDSNPILERFMLLSDILAAKEQAIWFSDACLRRRIRDVYGPQVAMTSPDSKIAA